MEPDPLQLPYPGLRAFARDESLLFFGRENCVDEMIDRLANSKFLAVMGASGSGKSSLVRTGLFEGLELGFYARAGSRWKIVDMHPGGSPLHHLAQALSRTQAHEENPPPAAMIHALLERGSRSLVEWAAGGALEPGENLLVFVDQFEELFRYADYAAREEAEAFVALLLESARSVEASVHIVITMRSEYLGACALIPGLAEQINRGFYLTPRMSREECQVAIEGPAAVLGFKIENALVTQILNDMASFAPWEDQTGVTQGQVLSRRADQLPLMQHLLNQLWLRAQERSNGDPIQLSLQDYKSVGGLSGALDQHGLQVMLSLSPEDRAFVPTVFRALISGPDATNAVRRPVRLKDIRAEANERAVGGDESVTRVVEAFRAANCNFIQPPPSHVLSDDTLIDISHESLIRQWKSLTSWLSDETRAEANWQRLVFDAQRHARSEGELLTGLDLASLELWWDAEKPTRAWAQRNGGGYDLAVTFLEESRSVRNKADSIRRTKARRERIRLLSTLTIVSTLLVVSTGATAYAYVTGFRIEKAQIELSSKTLALSQAELNLREAEEIRRAAELATERQREQQLALQAEKAALEALQAELTTSISDQQLRLRAAEDRALKAEDRAVKIASITGTTQNVRETIQHCEENPDEPACKVLFGSRRHRPGSSAE